MPAWVRADATALTQERMALREPSDAQDQSVRQASAELRFALMSCLSDAVFSEDPVRLMRAAAWVDLREEIDARLAVASPEVRGTCLECFSGLSTLDDCSDPDTVLGPVAAALLLNTDETSDHASAKLCRAAESRLAHAGIPGGVRARLGRTVAGLTGQDGASPEMLMGIAGAMETVATSLEQPLPDGPLVARQAVVMLDRRLHARLDLLERQATWLKECQDPWTHPEALASMRVMRHTAMVRRHLAAIASRANVQGMSDAHRKALIDLSERFRRSQDTSDDHVWILERPVEFAPTDEVGEALSAAGWPGTEGMARFHWRPDGALAVPAAHLHNALRAGTHARETGDDEAARTARRDARAAARDVLRLSGRK